MMAVNHKGPSRHQGAVRPSLALEATRRLPECLWAARLRRAALAPEELKQAEAPQGSKRTTKQAAQLHTPPLGAAVKLIRSTEIDRVSLAPKEVQHIRQDCTFFI